MMKPLLQLLVVWMVPWTCALLPPTNLTVESRNFNYTLHWHPAQGTPSGTEYRVYMKSDDTKPYVLLNVTKETRLSVSAAVREDIYSIYSFSVEAATHTNTSLPAHITLEPYNTELGPPVVRVKGCGDCLVVSISLPHGDGIYPDVFHTFRKSLVYNILWRKDSEDEVNSLESKHSNITISHLTPGERYCIRVELIRIPVHASDWLCTWTSPASEPKGLYLIMWSGGTVCVGVLLMLLFGALCYTGAICRPKLQLPQSLIFLVRGFFLSPEPVQIDTVCVSSECVSGAQRRHTPSQKPAPPHGSVSEEEEEEDEEEDCAYMDRPVAPSASSQGALGPDVASAAQYRRSWTPVEDIAAATGYHGNCSSIENMEQLKGCESEVKGHDPVTPLSLDNTQANSRERSEGKREIEGVGEREEKKEERSAGEMEERMERERKRDGGEEEVMAQERDEREEKGERDRGNEGKRGGVEDGDGEERREREGEREGLDALGDVNLFSVRLGGLGHTEEGKEEEEEEEEEVMAKEDRPLLDFGNTHTHRQTDEHTHTDTHGRTDDKPWTELQDTHTHTNTPSVFTPALTPSYTCRTDTPTPHTQLPLLGQVRFHTNPHSDIHTYTLTHSDTHTHSHTHKPKAGCGQLDGGSRHTGYLATQTGSVHTVTDEEEEEEEEDEDCAGYMTR